MSEEKKPQEAKEPKKNKYGVPVGVHLELADIRKMQQAAKQAGKKAE